MVLDDGSAAEQVRSAPTADRRGGHRCGPVAVDVVDGVTTTVYASPG
jgi:hypothetical protein